MRKTQHSLRSRWIIFAMVCLVLLQLVPSGLFTAKAQTILTPHVLTSGSQQDLLKEPTYKFTADGKQLIRLEIPQNGSLVIDLYAKNPGYITAEIYKTADASGLPVYMQAQCTSDRWNRGSMTHYFDKGTYYLRFPENTYEAGMLLYTSKNLSLKNGSVIAAYCDYNHENTYTFKATKNGYITISENALIDTAGSITAVLCNANGKSLTENAIFRQTQNNQITYAVKKNSTYKLKIKALNVNDEQYYQIHVKHASISETSGSTKKKAVSVKFGNKVDGTVYAEDAASKADWYKITNTKAQELLLNYSGSITSGSLILDVYDSKGRKLDSYSVISNIEEENQYTLHNASGGTKIAKGTYYIKITKSRKTSTGIYSFSLSGK